MIPITPLSSVSLPAELEKNEQLNQQWKTVPFYADQDANTFKSLSLLKDANIENSPENKPSQLAGLSVQQIQKCYTVKIIDDLYQKSIANYQESLINDTKADFALTLAQRNTSNDFTMAVATGAARFSAKAPNIPVIKQIVSPILALIGGIFGIIKKKKIVQERINSERSAHRNKWCAGVLVKEEARKNEAIELIKHRVVVLKFDIESMSEDFIDVSLFEELIILEKTIKVFDPSGSLFENGQSVREYMETRGIDESIIRDTE